MFEKYNKWINDFMLSWKNLESDKTISLLSEEVEYYENPIDKACGTFDEVKELWDVVDTNQKDISYKYEIICYDDNNCIVNWQMQRLFIPTNEIQEIDGIFQISLTDEGLCKYFKQWRFTRSKS